MTGNTVVKILKGEAAQTGNPELDAVLQRTGERLRALPNEMAEKLFQTEPQHREAVLREALEQVLLESDLFMMRHGHDLADQKY